MTLYSRSRYLSMVVLKVRVRRPNGARERYIVGNDREGTTDVTGVLGPCSYLARVTKLRNVELYQKQTRGKVRRRFTLLVTAVTWWDDRAGTDVTGGPDCCR